MPQQDVVRIVAVSDTHALQDQVPLFGALPVPDGDILIHAGDFSHIGEMRDLRSFNRWLASLPHRHKVVIAGNHDFCFEKKRDQAEAELDAAIYLHDSATTVEGFKIYGSPWQPWFHNWAFNLHRGPALAEKWAMIPDDTEILVTHGPPRGFGDRVHRGKRVGCDDLLAAIQRIRPRLSIFGHIHEDYGIFDDGETLYINASICTLQYSPTNPAIVIDLPRDPSQRPTATINRY